MEDEQREAMFNGWKLKEDEKHRNCKNHRWTYAEPIHCFDCGMQKTKFDELQKQV